MRRTGWLTLTIEVVRAACRVLCVLLAAGLAALAIDAVLGLYPVGLIAVDVLLVGLLFAAAGYIAWQSWRNRFDPRRIARQIERRLGLVDSRLINSVDLHRRAGTSASPQLVKQSVQRGEDFAARLSSLEVVDLWRPGRAVAAAVGALAVVLIAYLAAPRVFAMVVPRYLDPTGDHPPFSLLTFEIAVSPQTVYQGKPATIAAALGGPDLPDRANLVFVDGKDRQRLPMFRSDEGIFVLPIERAERTREFYIETPKGRSTRSVFSVLGGPLLREGRSPLSISQVHGLVLDGPRARRPRNPRAGGDRAVRFGDGHHAAAFGSAGDFRSRRQVAGCRRPGEDDRSRSSRMRKTPARSRAISRSRRMAAIG